MIAILAALVIYLVAAFVIGGLVFIAVMAIREDQQAASEYRELRIVTANHKPARDLPIHLDYPSTYDMRDVVFDMTDGRQPAHVVTVDAREITERELREFEGRN